jgi:signal transduction histidine kinase
VNRRSPTIWLLLGLVVTIAAVSAFAWYSFRQLGQLKAIQTNIIDRNRKDTLQLLRMESNLNSVGLAIRDMSAAEAEYDIFAYEAEFSRLQTDLSDAFQKEQLLAPASRGPAQQKVLESAADQMWATAASAFELSRKGQEMEAKTLIRGKLPLLQRQLSSLVATLLRQNNELEEVAASQVQTIYSGVERNLYVFLTLALLFIAATSLALILQSKRVFEQLALLSGQKTELAAQLIRVQERVLTSISRELHDDFGQILTAVGAMLNRIQKKRVPENDPLQTEVQEVRDIVQETLDKVRSLSQALHPVVIDDYGLEQALAWYAQVFEKQRALPTRFEATKDFPKIPGDEAIHVYRIAQEALNNAAKHAQASEAKIQLSESADQIRMTISDNGKGMVESPSKPGSGLGLVAMRERAALLNGTLNITSRPNYGTTIELVLPRTKFNRDDS